MPGSDIQLRVPDMHCEGCVRRVTNVLEQLEGVRSAEVSLDDKTAKVKIADGSVDVDALTAAVEAAGYSPEPA